MLVYANLLTLRLGFGKAPNKQRSQHEDAHSQEEKEMPETAEKMS